MYCLQRGFALITTLVFLEIVALLSLYAIQSNIWEMKMALQSWQKQSLGHAAEHVLQRAEMTSSNCLISSSKNIKKQPIPWWQANGCAGTLQGFQYFYVVEVLEGKENFRYTVLIVLKTNPHLRVMLQSVRVKGKRQSWRQII